MGIEDGTYFERQQELKPKNLKRIVLPISELAGDSDEQASRQFSQRAIRQNAVDTEKAESRRRFRERHGIDPILYR